MVERAGVVEGEEGETTTGGPLNSIHLSSSMERTSSLIQQQRKEKTLVAGGKVTIGTARPCNHLEQCAEYRQLQSHLWGRQLVLS